jgi:acetyl-CoA acetyltransferase
MVDMAALQASAYLEASGRDEKDLAAVAARAKGLTVDEVLAQPVTHTPLRDADIFPITDGTAAVVLAAGDLARSVCERPAWIRGLEHRIEAHSLGVRDLAVSESTKQAAAAAGVAGGPVDVAEVHAQFSHEELILTEALGLSDGAEINPSGGALASNPIMSAGLIRIGEVATRIVAGQAERGVAHATSGPCLQHNLGAVLEGA